MGKTGSNPRWLVPGEGGVVAFSTASEAGGTADRPPTAIPGGPEGESPRVRPPRTTGRLGDVLLLGLVLLVALPVLLLELDRPEVTDRREARAVATAVQTHAKLQRGVVEGETEFDRVAPERDGRTLWTEPPGTAWTQQVLLGRLEAPEWAMPRVVGWLRLTAAGMGLLMIASVFWAGHSLAGRRGAVIAGLLTVSSPMLMYQARLASPSIYSAAWVSLGIASGLWALRPLRPAPSIFRQALGWVVCGLATIMATLTAGPSGFSAVVLPILLVSIVCPNRVGHLLGWLAATLMGALGVMPWAMYAHDKSPEAWPVAAAEWLPWPTDGWSELASIAGWRLLTLLPALLPWTAWLVGAVTQPLSTSSRGVRVRLSLGWTWFATAVLGYLTASEPMARMGVILALPASAVLLSQMFQHYAEQADAGRFVRTWRALRWVQVTLLMAGSLAVMLWPWLGTKLIAWAWPTAPALAEMSWVYWLGGGLVLTGVAALGAKHAWKDFPSRATYAWAIWAVAAMLILTVPLARGGWAVSRHHADAGRINALVAGEGLYSLMPAACPLDPRLGVYIHRPIVTITRAELDLAERQAMTFSLLLPLDEPAPSDRYEELGRIESSGVTLWRFNVPTPE